MAFGSMDPEILSPQHKFLLCAMLENMNIFLAYWNHNQLLWIQVTFVLVMLVCEEDRTLTEEKWFVTVWEETNLLMLETFYNSPMLLLAQESVISQLLGFLLLPYSQLSHNCGSQLIKQVLALLK